MENGNNINANSNLEVEKKKNNKGLLIIIIILLSILILLFTYYLFFFESDNNGNDIKSDNDIVEKDEDKSETSTDEKEIIKDLDLNDPTVKKLSDRVIGICTNNLISDYNDYFYKQDYLDIKNRSLEFKIFLSTYQIFADALNSNSSNVTLTESEVKNAYESLFGENGGYKPTSFTSICGVKFEYKNGIYDSHVSGSSGDGPQCGDTSAGFSQSSLAFAKNIITSTEEKIELYEYYYYEDYSQGDDPIYYSDYNKKNIFFTGDSITKGEVINKYKDKLGQYKYTFIKDSDGVYVFTSVERVK